MDQCRRFHRTRLTDDALAFVATARVQREAQRLADTHMSGRTTRGSAATSTARTSGPASALFVAVESAAALYTYQTIAAIQSKSTPTYGLRFKCVDSAVQSRTGDPLIAASVIPSTTWSQCGWAMAMGGSSCIIYGGGDCTQAVSSWCVWLRARADLMMAVDLMQLAQVYFSHSPLTFSLALDQSFSNVQVKRFEAGMCVSGMGEKEPCGCRSSESLAGVTHPLAACVARVSVCLCRQYHGPRQGWPWHVFICAARSWPRRPLPSPSRAIKISCRRPWASWQITRSNPSFVAVIRRGWVESATRPCLHTPDLYLLVVMCIECRHGANRTISDT